MDNVKKIRMSGIHNEIACAMCVNPTADQKRNGGHCDGKCKLINGKIYQRILDIIDNRIVT